MAIGMGLAGGAAARSVSSAMFTSSFVGSGDWRVLGLSVGFSGKFVWDLRHGSSSRAARFQLRSCTAGQAECSAPGQFSGGKTFGCGIRFQEGNGKQVSHAFRVLLFGRSYSGGRTDSGPSLRGSDSPRSSVAVGVLSRQAVSEPFVGEGNELYENEYMAREAVLKYLKSEKIETSELESVALPPSVTVMAERITFLMKIGLTKKDINEYPLMLGSSVKKNLIPVLSFLEKLNVEARFLPDLIRKYPMVLNASVTMDLEPVVDFLMGIGIERINLGRVLTRFPDVFGFKIEGTMSTSVAYLVSIGVNMREVGPMITEYPEILGMRVGNNIKPKVDYLLSLGMPKVVLAKVLEVKPFILGFDLENNIKKAVQGLRDVGVREELMAHVLTQYADVLGMEVKQRLDTKNGWLSKQAGVKRENLGQILEKLPQILAINIALAQSRVTFLRDEGFSLEDVGTMVTSCPQILALSVDGVLKPNLDFYRRNMNRPLTDIVNYPFYFTYDLDKRIRPRYIQIEQKGIRCSMSWFLNCSDSSFANKLLVDFVERPDEAEEPFVSVGGRVKIKGQDQIQEVFDEESSVAAES